MQMIPHLHTAYHRLSGYFSRSLIGTRVKHKWLSAIDALDYRCSGNFDYLKNNDQLSENKKKSKRDLF